MEYQELFCRDWTAEDCDSDTDQLLAAASDEYESGGSTNVTASPVLYSAHGHAHSNERTLRFAQPLPDEQIIGAKHKLVFPREPKKDKIQCHYM